MSKREVWWIVAINFGGITGPIRCIKKDETNCWDRSGNYQCSMKAGIWPIGYRGRECSQFQTTSKHEADIFYSGAKSVAKLITYLMT